MSNNYVDIKVTIWNRLCFNEGIDMSKLVEILEANPVEVIMNEENGLVESRVLLETEELMQPCENDGQSTIEVYKSNKMIWNNAIIHS
ncbi:hypothetical protein [Pseudoflavitalea rhizosphaerae]|uniref:hypothetical protein n=1 Tax=Pseudoflavitalea rhizosphaerae TaxID=1884793 RepID=UPI000F8CEAD2|nr:hypothetical protein [Pseudoflavitalea rhizosphaerae]